VMPANHLFLNIVFSFGNENRPLDARQRPRLRPIVAIRARRVARLSNQIAADRSIHAVCDEACRVSQGSPRVRCDGAASVAGG
jgi:hypothetical protein